MYQYTINVGDPQKCLSAIFFIWAEGGVCIQVKNMKKRFHSREGWYVYVHFASLHAFSVLFTPL